MLSSAANRIDPQRALGNRLGNRGVAESLPPGMALTQIFSGVMENWDEIERQMPWYQAPKSDRTPLGQKVVQETSQSARPLTKEEKAKNPLADANSPTGLGEGEEGLLGEKAPLTAVNKPEAAKTEMAAATPEKGAEKGAEVTAQAALNWRAPEVPRVEGQAVPASFAVPNHSAGASGFGSTWSHAAKQGNDNIIHSE